MLKNAVITQNLRVVSDDEIEVIPPGRSITTTRAKRTANRKTLTGVTVTKSKADVWDPALPGFGVRVSGKRRSYQIMFRLGGKLHRVSLGSTELFADVEEAREKARGMLRAAKNGVDPRVQAVVEQKTTVRSVFARYVEDKTQPADRDGRAAWRPRSRDGAIGRFKRDILPAWGERPINSITKADVVALVDAKKREAPVSANRLHASLSAFFNWAVGKLLIERSPVTGTEKPTKERSRDRVLDEAEIKAMWRAAGEMDNGFGRMAQFLLATAQRRDEARFLTWSEIDVGDRTWTIPADRAKNGKRHEVALSDLAVSILGVPAGTNELVFASETGETALGNLGRSKRRLDRLMGKPPRWTLHDLRRTAVSKMAELGVRHEVADKVLNHATGAIAGVGAVYQRHQYKAEQRDALLRWSKKLAEIVGGTKPPTIAREEGARRETLFEAVI